MLEAVLCTDGGLVGIGNLEKLSSIHRVYTLDSQAHTHTHYLAEHNILHIRKS